MRFQTSAAVAALLLAVLGIAGTSSRSRLEASEPGASGAASASAAAGAQYGGQTTITCSSNDGRRKYCGRYNYDQVRLERQISGSPCERDRTWGVDRDGLWVDRGCRATFIISSYPEGPGGPGRPEGPGGGWWHPDPGDRWPPRGDWRGGNWERGGACFYKNSNFSGDFFCMRRGEQNNSIVNGYGDQISSIRVFGGARAIIYDDRDFRGPRLMLKRDASDLRGIGVQGKPGHSWNDRINSVIVQ